jgi:hypothetical protein
MFRILEVGPFGRLSVLYVKEEPLGAPLNVRLRGPLNPVELDTEIVKYGLGLAPAYAVCVAGVIDTAKLAMVNCTVTAWLILPLVPVTVSE